MKRILLLFLPFLPYLATAQVAKDTVTVLTIADIPAAEIRDTTNITFVQDNGFKKATFDSLYKYTRVKLLATGAITSAELANALSNETGTGAAVFATSPALTTPNLGTPSAATLTNATGLPIATGLTGMGAANRIPYSTSATAMTTGAGLTFDGTNFATTGTATATKFIPTGGAATGNGMYLPTTNTLAFSTNGLERMRIDASGNIISGESAAVYLSRFTLAYNPETNNGPIFLDNRDYTSAGGGAFFFGGKYNSAGNYAAYGGILSVKSNPNDGDKSGYFMFLTNNNANDPVERMRITSNGSVNIGGDYTQTTHTLNVTGTGNFTSTLHAASGSAGAPSVTNTGNTDTGMWFPAADVVGFSTGGVERMRVKADGQIRFIPLAADPAGAENGDVYYNSSTHKLRVYANGTWVDLH